MGVFLGSSPGLQGVGKGRDGGGDGVRPSGSILLLFEDAELRELARSDSGVLRDSVMFSLAVKELLVAVPTVSSFLSKFVMLSGLYLTSLSLSFSVLSRS